MKKLFLAVLLLGLAFDVNAASIPVSIEPKEGGGDIWLLDVYVDTASTAIDAGDVVCWNMDASTGDDDNWVEQCGAADTYLVAGVAYPGGVAAGERGTIAIRGPVPVDVLNGLNTVNGLACSSGTGGAAKSCDTQAANFGIVTQVAASGTAVVCVNCNK